MNRCLDALAAHFASSGAKHLDLPFLYPSEELLNLYGEDLRARAFLYGDAERGNELCLRPDFTVPVALAHRNGGWQRRAHYTYSGPVFRLQPSGDSRPVEYVQAGVERFGDPEQAQTDAEVFLNLWSGVKLLGVDSLTATIGDLSIVLAVLDALEMPDRRRSELKRHLWRPNRFRQLLDRAVESVPASVTRRQILSSSAGDRLETIARAGEDVGLRTVAEVAERLEILSSRDLVPPMARRDAMLISEILSISGPINEIVSKVDALTRRAGVDISPTLEHFEARRGALQDGGCLPDALYFDASFGRSLEYYDGFVFELREAGAAEHPPLAGGGRYNAMTVRLGADAAVPAIGGIVRPEAVLDRRR